MKISKANHTKYNYNCSVFFCLHVTVGLMFFAADEVKTMKHSIVSDWEQVMAATLSVPEWN